MNQIRLEEINKKLDRVISLLEKSSSSSVNIEKTNQRRLVKIEDAEIITGYKKKYIYYLTHHNSIPFHKVGHSIRFDPDELDAWMRAGRPSVINETIKKFKK